MRISSRHARLKCDMLHLDAVARDVWSIHAQAGAPRSRCAQASASYIDCWSSTGCDLDMFVRVLSVTARDLCGIVCKMWLSSCSTAAWCSNVTLLHVDVPLQLDSPLLSTTLHTSHYRESFVVARASFELHNTTKPHYSVINSTSLHNLIIPFLPPTPLTFDLVIHAS